MPATLSLAPVVDIEVFVSPAAAPRRTFNQGLIIGSSNRIAAATRIALVNSMADVIALNFLSSDPEYKAAALYFGQSPAPIYGWIGRRDLTAIETGSVGSSGGTGYIVGDTLTVVQSGGSGGTFAVLTINSGTGAVTSLTGPVTKGTGYAAASNLATTTNSEHGASCTITITVGETAVDALEACRAAGPDWYPAMVCGTTKAEHKLCAAWAETATPPSLYMFTTQDAEVPAGTAGNVFLYCQTEEYTRAIGQYSSAAMDPAGLAIAAIMGYAMGQNSGLSNSAFTLKFKQEVGILPETALTPTQVLAIESAGGNVYVNRGSYYNMFEQGVMTNGRFFDSLLNSDMLANNMQLNVMDLLYGTPKVPQTEPGVTQIIHAINMACDQAVPIGYLAPGTYDGYQPVLNLNPGDPMPKGYVTQAAPLSTQSSADRSARKAPALYCVVKEAGAIHSCTIGVWINA